MKIIPAPTAEEVKEEQKRYRKTLNTHPTTREETVILSGIQEKDDLNISCAIQRSSTWIHKWCMRGGGQFLVVEGKKAAELVKRQDGFCGQILSNRYQVVFIDGGIYKNCITVVRRGEYMKFTLKKARKIDNGDFPDVSIPEIVCTPTKTRRKDFVCTIHIEEPKDETHTV